MLSSKKIVKSLLTLLTIFALFILALPYAQASQSHKGSTLTLSNINSGVGGDSRGDKLTSEGENLKTVNPKINLMVIKSLKIDSKSIVPKNYYFDTLKINTLFKAAQANTCTHSMDPKSCFFTYLALVAQNKGTLTQAWKSLPAEFNNYCSDVSTNLGEYLGNLPNSNIKIIDGDPQLCGDHFSSSFVDAYLSSKPKNSNFATLCDSLSHDSRWLCSIHLGMFYLNQNISDPINAALKCYALPSPDDSHGNHMTFRRACLSGAWQSFFNNSSVINYFAKNSIDANAVFSFCLSSPRSSKEVCLQEDSNPFNTLPQFKNLELKFASCQKLLDRDLVDQCYFGMARGASDAVGGDPIKLYNSCIKINNLQSRDYCFIAGGEALNSQSYSGIMKSFCKSSLNKVYCSRNLGEMIYGMLNGSATKAISYCEQFYLPSECQEGSFRGLSRISFVHTAPITVADIFNRCTPYTTLLRFCQSVAGVGVGNYLNNQKDILALLNFCSLNKNEGCFAAAGIIAADNIVTVGELKCQHNQNCEINFSQELAINQLSKNHCTSTDFQEICFKAYQAYKFA